MGISRLRQLQLRYREFERFVTEVIYNQRRDKKAKRLGAFLRLLSFPFLWIVKLRVRAYEKRWLRSQHLGCMVIVVGNLTVGGTGKTPVVEKIARALSQNGRRVAILSRGYKSKKEAAWKQLLRWVTHAQPPLPKLVSDGKKIHLSSEEAGDEPYLLARNLPDVTVLVDKDRVKAGQYAIRQLAIDTLVLDDGFQYLQLKGSFYLTLVDASNPFGNGALLPRGILREPLVHLKRAHYIFLTKTNTVLPERIRALRRYIRKYNKKADILECIHQPKFLQRVEGPDRLELSTLKLLPIAALSAIAAPESFENFLKNQGALLVHSERYTDHHRFAEEDLKEFFQKAKDAGARCVITTEKDAVRIPFSFEPSLPFYFLRMEIELTQGMDKFEEVLSKLSYSFKKGKNVSLPL